MKLSSRRFLFLDCQTTGMRPSSGGRLLEIAWGLGSAEDETIHAHSSLVRLPEGEDLPKMVSEITGITKADLELARPEEEVFAALAAAADGAPTALIHYAQFEKPFLEDLYLRLGQGASVPFGILCTQRLTKKLFPNLPSQNIRGATGFFGHPVHALKRAASHVTATHQIWRGLTRQLAELGIGDEAQLADFLDKKPEKRKVAVKPRYDYRLDRVKRLELPDSPGVYRMLAKNGDVLYVGKATSLKSRVNSYFRGVSGRDRRKLEMLAQVWDLDVSRCRTALEAALLEADEIKRFNPPYNVVMKRGQRVLCFYAPDFSSSSTRQSDAHPLGPFRPGGHMETLRQLADAQITGEFGLIFWEPIENDLLWEGFRLFLERHGLSERETDEWSVRDWLAFGLNLHRHHVEDEREEEEQTEEATDTDYTADDLAGKFERLMRRAGAEYWGVREISRLLDARVSYHMGQETLVLEFAGGLQDAPARPLTRHRWLNLDIETYDRMNVLRSELNKYEHRIEPRFQT